MHDIGVVYLCRFAEGEAPVRRFLDVLGRREAGEPYDLHVIFKGFPDVPTLSRASALFDGIRFNAIELNDRGYDIGSYAEAARKVANRRLVFFNTFSDILSDNWLLHLNNALNQPRAGIVGATGSWQSRTTGYEVWARYILRRMKLIFSRTAKGSTPAQRTVLSKPSGVRILLAPLSYFYHMIWYPRYPNPHIRTNAFMIDRELFLSLRIPSFDKKEDAYRFESGRHSMTRQIMHRGLRPLVVDRQGAVYDVEHWDMSFTFWRNRQENLLIADNRTKAYSEGSNDFRTLLENSAWRHPRSWLNV